jgi:queuine tRNA-ribosyltransferase
VQGGLDPELRCLHAAQLAEFDFAGYAVGGLSVGEERSVTREVAAAAAEALPQGRPRYLMGVGLPEDLLRFVAMGYDLFDCVLPTRNGRNGMLFTSCGRVNIRLARYARDPSPPDADCDCYVCSTFSRGYLRHLAVAGEMLGAQLATAHNLHFYLHLMEEARRRIEAGDFGAWARSRIERMEGEVKA